MHFFLVLLIAVGSLPLNIISALDTPVVRAADGPSDAPEHQKILTPNDDGTYTITLSVKGKASSSTVQNVTKSNVILVVDTSNSMNSNANGYDGTRLEAEKNALTKTDGIIDKLLANNTTEIPDIIELYGVNFGTSASRAWDWSTDGSAIKSAINGLSTNTGTNWEEALILARQAADAKLANEPDENTYVIFMTDGEPTTHQNDYSVNTNYAQEWGHANDDARGIVTAGHTFYGIFTFGSDNRSSYLKSLVNYAYTGSGTYNSPLSPAYAQYFYDATDTQALIEALEAIVDEISSSVGYTNIAMTDGLTDLTSSMKVDGKISNLTYTRSGGSYGSGTVWDNAPEATTTDGTINWNLGSTVLEDGVTYSVSFLVWPKQESYDLIVDLNNGKITYDELTDSQKSSVIENPGGLYTLKTNTDYPTLTYSTITTTTSSAGTETVISDPTTIEIQNPDPVGLATEKLTLEKKWEDSLDPSQREEVNGEVTLHFFRDGQPYEQNITLTEANNWKLEDYISIAPGIIISNESENYDLLKSGHTEYSFNGKTYIILETGHDYYFEEEDINNHFELTNYIYHPMLVDGVMKNVFFTRDDAGNITGIEEFKEMDSVSATNTLKGGINIEKKVVDQSGNAVDTDDSFEITAHLLDADGNPYSYDYRIYYGEKNPEYESHKVYDAEGNFRFSRSDHIYGEGTLTEFLYVGDVIRIVNVDAGVQYYVEETEKSGYASNPTITYKETYGTDDPDDATQAENGYYVVSGNTASSATITNKFLDEKTRVDFEKTWYDADGNELSGETLPGSITVELFKKGADGEVVSTGQTRTVTADDDWKASFTDLTKYDNGVEIVYSIEESAIEGATYEDEQEAFFEYDTEENNGQYAVIGKWEVMTLDDYILQNTWTPATETVTGSTSLSVKKIDASTKKALEGATFELKPSNGSAISRTTDGNGEATFDNLDAGEYSLKETAAPSDYQSISTEPTINITKIKKLNQVDLTNLNNVYEYVFSISTTNVTGYTYDAESRTFTVENEAIPYTDITAAKVWDDGEDRDGLRKDYANYYVAVKNNSGKYVAYEQLALEDKDDYEFTHLPKKTVGGDDITYEIVEASTCSGEGDSIECTEFEGDDFYSVSIEDGIITNTHEPETKTIVLKKTWDVSAGNLPTSTPTFIMVELSNDQGDEPKTIRLEGTGYGEWTSDEITVFVYANQGKKVTYQVKELGIDAEENLTGEKKDTLYIYNGDLLEGKWVTEPGELTVKNTWTPAAPKYVFEGEDKFEIVKVDEEGNSLSGVVFSINGEDETTDDAGTIELEVPISETEAEEKFEYEITEKETIDGYEMAEGSAIVTVICTSELDGANEEELVNRYVKTCKFEAETEGAFEWDEEEMTLTVVNEKLPEPEPEPEPEPIDPCAKGGCGGVVIVPVITPETGRMTKSQAEASASNTLVASVMTMGLMTLVASVVFLARKRR